MSVSKLPNQPSIHEDVHNRLDLLRDRLYKMDPAHSHQSIWDGFRDAIDNILTEHSGMADELLCVYEQLGVVFDVTRRLSVVQRESEMVELLVESLSRSFAHVMVFAVYPDGRARSSETKSSQKCSSMDLKLVLQSKDRQSVMTESFTTLPQPDGTIEAMVGPVFSGDSHVCSIFLKRQQNSPAFRASDMLLLESLTLFCGDLIRNHRLVNELREMSLAMVRSLVNAVDQKDEYTSGHSLRVGYYASLLGEDLGLGDLELQMLQWSALLHDVGKIGIRDSVLKKEGKLTPEEYEHIKEHPVRSHQVVEAVPQLSNALDGVLHHHERYDGQGYPQGLRGEDIPFQARIIQIADVFDALTSTRSYRPAYTWPAALDILTQEAGVAIDPILQSRFDQLIRKKISDKPGAWEKMVNEANRFMQTNQSGSEVLDDR